jgi:hypothetical protein
LEKCHFFLGTDISPKPHIILEGKTFHVKSYSSKKSPKYAKNRKIEYILFKKPPTKRVWN